MVPAALEKLGRQFQTDAVTDLAARHEKRVQTRRKRMSQYLAIIDERPLGARRTAFCNQGNILTFDHYQFG